MLMQYQFFARRTENLGHVIRSGRLITAKRTIDAVETLENSTIKIGFCFSLGVWKADKRFVLIFACLAASLDKNVRK